MLKALPPIFALIKHFRHREAFSFFLQTKVLLWDHCTLKNSLFLLLCFWDTHYSTPMELWWVSAISNLSPFSSENFLLKNHGRVFFICAFRVCALFGFVLCVLFGWLRPKRYCFVFFCCLHCYSQGPSICSFLLRQRNGCLQTQPYIYFISNLQNIVCTKKLPPLLFFMFATNVAIHQFWAPDYLSLVVLWSFPRSLKL